MEFYIGILLIILSLVIWIFVRRKKHKILDVHDTGDQPGLLSGEYFHKDDKKP